MVNSKNDTQKCSGGICDHYSYSSILNVDFHLGKVLRMVCTFSLWKMDAWLCWICYNISQFVHIVQIHIKQVYVTFYRNWINGSMDFPSTFRCSHTCNLCIESNGGYAICFWICIDHCINCCISHLTQLHKFFGKFVSLETW